MTLKEKIYEILPQVSRPSRYAGLEKNSVIKQGNHFKVALCYPDLYDIGMANLAIKILYKILNEENDIYAQRVFAPWMDMEEQLRKNHFPLYALETFTPIHDFDVLAITIPFEMVGTNILNILSLSNVPLHANERGENDLFVIGGGPATTNPEPFAPFFDGFLIGEGESAIVEIVKIIKEGKENQHPRNEILKKLNEIKGFYVPILNNISYDENQFFIQNSPSFEINKKVEKDLNYLKQAASFPVPWVKIAQDKGMVEVLRGCYHRCRFCQAGHFYKPVRERDPIKIEEAVKQIFFENGLREFSLLSLSTGDYSNLAGLMKKLNQDWKDNFVSFFLPSIKVNSFNLDLLDELNINRKGGLTLAVEAGSDKIRKMINKDVSDEKLMQIVREASKKGWNLIKLYFMIGLTDDIEEEKKAIIETINLLLKVDKKLRFNVSINMFIPKPHTAFQWNKLYSPQLVLEKLKEIGKYFWNNKKVKMKKNDPKMAFIEGIIARGNRQLANVILFVYERGVRFEGWSEGFDFDIWMDALNKHEEFFKYEILTQNLNQTGKLPWSFINTGISNDFLSLENKRAQNCESSENCFEQCVDYCGSCNDEAQNIKASDNYSTEIIPQLFRKANEDQLFVGVVFTKLGPLRFLSQLELMSFWEKLIICSGLPLVFTEGFNPHPRIEFGFTPPVGIESFYENFRFRIGEKIDIQVVKEKLSDQFTNGEILNVSLMNQKPKSLQSITIYQDLRLEKVSVLDEKLLFLIRENGEILDENDLFFDFRLPLKYKIKNLQDYCNFYQVKRLRLLTEDKNEVI